MEPASATTGSTWAKIAASLKDWPLWLFVAVALSLTVFLLVPEFRQLVPAAPRDGVLFAGVVAWILAVCKAVPSVVKHIREKLNNRLVFRLQSGFWKYADKENVIQINATLHVINRREQNAVLSGPKICLPKFGRKREWQSCFQVEVGDQLTPLGMIIGPRLDPRSVSEMRIRHIHRQAAQPRPGTLVCVFQIHDRWGRYHLRLRIEPAPAFAPRPAASLP